MITVKYPDGGHNTFNSHLEIRDHIKSLEVVRLQAKAAGWVGYPYPPVAMLLSDLRIESDLALV